tara:strand:+ start:16922 stop:17836 length:915 start_codon:yes stop_codon:yes gene_type:complete
MKKNFILFLVTFLFLTILSSCKFSNVSKSTNKKVLLTSFTILEDIVRNIAGEAFLVESITKPGMEVHGYKTTPSDLIRGSKAVLFFENGFGLELWSDKFTSNLDVKRISISDNLKPIYIDEDAYEGKPNPHAWISPKRGKIYIDIIVNALKDLDPENSSIFEKNGTIYKTKINKIDEDFKRFLNTIEKSKRYLVSCEGAFSYLANDYGLKEAYLWPVNAESQVTPKRMANLINLIKENEIPSVFCESTVSAEAQLTVARESGAKFGGNFYVDSLSSKNGPAPNYIDLLNYNLQLIKKGFSLKIK